MYIDNHIITLNSTDATKLNSTYLSNVTFPFKGLLGDESNIVRSYISVLNAQIPVSFYVLDSTNNVLAYFNTYNNTTQTLTVPVGNYNANSLVTALNVAAAVYVGYVPVFSFNTTTGCISVVSSYIWYPNGSQGTTIGDIIGIQSILSNSFTFTYPLNLLGRNKLFINSSHLNNVAYTSKNMGFAKPYAQSL